MYNPGHFAERRPEVLAEAISKARLATLVTMGPDGLTASHLPILFDPTAGEFGTVRGHLARANPQWQSFDASVPALLIVQGPEAYVSPSWYPTKAEHGKVVPTWNYVTIHAYGTLSISQDREWLREVVTRLTDREEAARPAPWAVTDAPTDFIDGMLGAIVGIELPLTRVGGKWKMSQNRPAGDRAGVVAGLAASTDPSDQAAAKVMRALDEAR